MKDLYLFDDDEIYAEAVRRIKECAEKGKKTLDFSSLSLKTLPPEIAGLEKLAELDISDCKLAAIPDFMGNLRSLKRLSVGSRYSSAHDSEIEKIVLPQSLKRLTNLQNLYVGYGVEIPEWLWDMDHLTALSICNDRIEALPAEIGNLKNLGKLRIYGAKIAALPDEIGHNLPLTVLDLQCPRMKAMPESFSHLKKMTTLAISDCNFSALPDFICEWTELEGIILSMENTFQGPFTELTKIPANIGNLKKLRVLELEGTNIKKLPDSLCECPLERFTVSGDFRSLPENFGKLTRLKELELNAYKLKTVPLSFGSLSSLEVFHFRGGNLGELPESFGNLSSLKNLDIITGQDIRLPETFGNLSALEDFCIDAEKMRVLPESIGNCNALKLFMLESDALTELPRSFVNLVHLEEFHADTFNLKNLPADFGNLAALKSLHIFSGALTTLPESIGTLKKLKSLWLDIHNVVYVPDSFEQLSYVKSNYIITGNTGRGKQKRSGSSSGHSKKNADFEELKTMSNAYRWKILEGHSLKELESLLCSVPRHFSAGETDKEIVKDIMLKRRQRLNRKFKWTEENIRRIAEVSDRFLAAWEAGFAKAKSIIDMLYEKETDKNAFWQNYDVEITLDPEILIKDAESGELDYSSDTVYEVIMDYLNSEFELNIMIGKNDYDPVTKDESGFRKDIFICRDLSWNIEGFGDIDLAEQYICYAIHILYSHNEWANEDILKINRISSQVKITREDDTGIF
jgi:Leucine-rich repeat (LRR) protein